MARVRWLAGAPRHRRVLSQEDLESIGVESEALVFDDHTAFTLEMDDDQADNLVKVLPEEFIVLDAPLEEEASPEPEAPNPDSPEGDESPEGDPESLPFDDESVPAPEGD